MSTRCAEKYSCLVFGPLVLFFWNTNVLESLCFIARRDYLKIKLDVTAKDGLFTTSDLNRQTA